MISKDNYKCMDDTNYMIFKGPCVLDGYHWCGVKDESGPKPAVHAEKGQAQPPST